MEKASDLAASDNDAPDGGAGTSEFAYAKSQSESEADESQNGQGEVEADAANPQERPAGQVANNPPTSQAAELHAL